LNKPNGGSGRMDLPPARMQYTGDYRGATWNSQAMFASQATKQEMKMSYVWKINRRQRLRRSSRDTWD
jgi:hypothetical protein